MTSGNSPDESDEGKEMNPLAILRGMAQDTHDQITAFREEALEQSKATFEAASSAEGKVLELGRYVENLRDTISANESSATIAWELAKLNSYMSMIQDEVRLYQEDPIYRSFMRDYRLLVNEVTYAWSTSRVTDAKTRDQLVKDTNISVNNFINDTVTGLSEKLNG